VANDLLIQTCDAIKDAIAAVDWGLEFAIERSYADVDATLEELDRLRVDVVVPEEWDEHILDTKADEAYVATIEVAIRKRFGVEGQNQAAGGIRTEAIDELVTLASTMARYFTADRLNAFDTENVSWQSMQLAQLYSRRQLAESRQFTAIIEFTFEISTPRA
jgi:hypothetical protein